MGLFTLLAALIGTISDTVKENKNTQKEIEATRRYENIDFYNIESVIFSGVETAYRIETEEEFDPVMTDFLTQQDGWQHYETKTVEYEVENGKNCCFIIKYKDGTKEYRKFHETSQISKQLLKYCERK
jgi:hypothetical protein